jgi:NAD-dependent DNA ligase
MLKINPPTHCPSCASELEWKNHILYCVNPECGSQAQKKIEHFSKSLKIKGLGPATIKKLGLVSISEIYTLTAGNIGLMLGSVKIAAKLSLEIENSRKASLNRLLPAFAIPLVGKSASGKLAAVCTNLYDIDEKTCKQAGLGVKTTANLLNWLYTNNLMIEALPFSFNFEKPRSPGNKGTICISGRLKSYKTKAEATTVLSDLGYEVKPSMTKDVTILINESGIESAKTKRARDSGVTIVTNIKDFIGE